jgi:hypothetical protein
MRTSTAYFAGAGTVVAAIAAGLGGGLLIANMVSPATPKQGTESTHLERRMASAPVQATTGPTEPVPYLGAPQPVASAVVAAAPTQAPAQTEPAKPTEPANSNSAASSADAARMTVPAAAQAGAPAAPPSTSAAAAEEPTAKSREAEARRDADVKRTVDKRKFERRPQWAEKRRNPRSLDQELQAVEQSVREDTEPRRDRVFAAEPVRGEMPVIRLFGSD